MINICDGHEATADDFRRRRPFYANTRIREVEHIAGFAEEAAARSVELFHNGRKPALKPMPYAANRMLTVSARHRSQESTFTDASSNKHDRPFRRRAGWRKPYEAAKNSLNLLQPPRSAPRGLNPEHVQLRDHLALAETAQLEAFEHAA